MIIIVIIFLIANLVLCLCVIEHGRWKIKNKSFLEGMKAGREETEYYLVRTRKEAVEKGYAEWRVTNNETGATFFVWK